MADISKCTGKGCKLKKICYRHTAPENEFRQSYSMFEQQIKPGDTHCEDFWPDGPILKKETNGTDE